MAQFRFESHNGLVLECENIGTGTNARLMTDEGCIPLADVFALSHGNASFDGIAAVTVKFRGGSLTLEKIIPVLAPFR